MVEIRKRVARTPVSAESFGRLRQWVLDNEEKLIEAFPDVTEGYKARKSSVEVILDLLHNYQWGSIDEDEIKKTDLISHPKWVSGTFVKNASFTRKVLTEASKSLKYDKDAHIEVEECNEREVKVTLFWEKRESTEPRKPGKQAFQTVHVVFRHWWSEYVDELLRGMFAMAELFKVDVKIHKVGTDKEIYGAIEALIEKSSSDLSIVVILGDTQTLHDEMEQAKTNDKVKGRKLQITTVGHDNSNIHQDNREMSRLLASQMIEDATGTNTSLPRKLVLIRSNTPLEDGVRVGDAFSIREKTIRRVIGNNSQILVIDDKLEIALTREQMFGVTVADDVKKLVDELLADDADKEVGAMYAQTSLVGLGALRAIKERKREQDVKVYCEYVSPFLLRWLSIPGSPLWAVAGSDPFHYGKMVLRASVVLRKPHQTYPPIQPFLITRAMVQPTKLEPDANGNKIEKLNIDASIGYMVEIPEKLAQKFPELDFRVDHSQYAWEQWMKRRMPLAYGPDLMENE